MMFSGGLGSFMAADRVLQKYGPGAVTLLFTDTKTEDPDLYRFLDDAERVLGVPITRLADGRDIWQVFRDERFLGNTRVDPCSRVLKRDLASAWLEENCDPADTVVYVGIDWSEEHRFTRLRDRWAAEGWRYEAPLVDDWTYTRAVAEARLTELSVALPRLYRLGFPHNNCGGGCVKAGVRHFARLLEQLPDVYADWERNEQALRDFLGKDVSILRDRTGGRVKPLTLTQLRRRVEGGTAPAEPEQPFACNCFAPPCDGEKIDDELEAMMDGAPAGVDRR